ncbi:hypothetical protein J3Q64DRAFT_1740470 [Phycomyces blakesleeanus]|uniref:Uncharacterized protein n=1 Tax=Phycomyces blakesleeanus TaxID=4837 RepID=A0ABR3B1L3_PHYBL
MISEPWIYIIILLFSIYYLIIRCLPFISNTSQAHRFTGSLCIIPNTLRPFFFLEFYALFLVLIINY